MIRRLVGEKIQRFFKRIAEIKIMGGGKGADAELQALKKENEMLKQEVDKWQKKLVITEIMCGIRQVPVPLRSTSGTRPTLQAPIVNASVTPTAPEVPKTESKQPRQEKKKEKAPKAEKPKVEAKKSVDDEVVDVSRLDFRVGKILDVKKHPDADTLYVEEVDVAEEKTRTVVSGLVKHIPIEEMKDRLVVLLCNLKPAKMRGVTSQAMVMCASTPDKVEILIPPSGSVPGDVVDVEGYTRKPDAVLNPKKKIFETVAPDLKVDENKHATYKGKTLLVEGKGNVVSPSLTGVAIK